MSRPPGNNTPFSNRRPTHAALLKFRGPRALPCLQQLMILSQTSGLQQVQFCCSKWEPGKRQWRVPDSVGNETWQGAYYWRQLHASQGHSEDSGAGFNGPRIHWPFLSSLLSPSNENIEQVIVTIKLPQSSVKKKIQVDLSRDLENGSSCSDSKGERSGESRTRSLCLVCLHQSIRAPARDGWVFTLVPWRREPALHLVFSKSLKTHGQPWA